MKTKDYSKTKIYSIKCNKTNKEYIGSTISDLKKRLREHKSDYKSYKKNKKNYISSFSIIENGDYNIMLLEEYQNCKNNFEKREREAFYILKNKCENKNIPNRTKQQYYKDKRIDILKHQNKKNKCLCGGLYTNAHKAIHNKTKKHNDFYKYIL